MKFSILQTNYNSKKIRQAVKIMLDIAKKIVPCEKMSLLIGILSFWREDAFKIVLI